MEIHSAVFYLPPETHDAFREKADRLDRLVNDYHAALARYRDLVLRASGKQRPFLVAETAMPDLLLVVRRPTVALEKMPSGTRNLIHAARQRILRLEKELKRLGSEVRTQSFVMHYGLADEVEHDLDIRVEYRTTPRHLDKLPPEVRRTYETQLVADTIRNHISDRGAD
jgi:hypothetical protein